MKRDCTPTNVPLSNPSFTNFRGFYKGKSTSVPHELQECGQCGVKDIDPPPFGCSSAILIDGKWYHVEKHRPCAANYKKSTGG